MKQKWTFRNNTTEIQMKNVCFFCSVVVGFFFFFCFSKELELKGINVFALYARWLREKNPPEHWMKPWASFIYCTKMAKRSKCSRERNCRARRCVCVWSYDVMHVCVFREVQFLVSSVVFIRAFFYSCAELAFAERFKNEKCTVKKAQLFFSFASYSEHTYETVLQIEELNERQQK